MANDAEYDEAEHADRVREETARALESIEAAYRWKLTLGPIVLEAEYLRAIDALEALPRNRAEADKAWLDRMVEATRAHFEELRRDSGSRPSPNGRSLRADQRVRRE